MLAKSDEAELEASMLGKSSALVSKWRGGLHPNDTVL